MMSPRINAPTNASTGILATDLDGTLIPLDDHPQNKIDLCGLQDEIRKHRITLVFVTGRHLKSVESAIQEHYLPQPDWIICDVGSSIYQRNEQGEWSIVTDYEHRLQAILKRESIFPLASHLEHLQALRLQEKEKQGRFKLSYYCDAASLTSLRDAVVSAIDPMDPPCEIIASVDPFNGDGLIDILPAQVSKAFALRWWAEFYGFSNESIVFAGDSGNDLAAMTEGYRTIVVGNADRALAAEVRLHHEANGWKDRIHLSKSHATSGVLEGCRHFQSLIL